jgi:membrane protein required for colicin V production
MGNFSLTDLLLGGVSIYWVAKGFWVGLSGELFSLAGIASGFFLAFQGGPAAARWLLEQSWSPTVSGGILTVVCGLVIFILCNLFSTLIGRAARKGLKAVKLGGMDRFMGAVAGAAKAVVLLVFLYGIAMVASSGRPPAWASESRLLNSVSLLWPKASQQLGEWELFEPGRFPFSPREEKR